MNPLFPHLERIRDLRIKILMHTQEAMNRLLEQLGSTATPEEQAEAELNVLLARLALEEAEIALIEGSKEEE